MRCVKCGMSLGIGGMDGSDKFSEQRVDAKVSQRLGVPVAPRHPVEFCPPALNTCEGTERVEEATR